MDHKHTTGARSDIGVGNRYPSMVSHVTKIASGSNDVLVTGSLKLGFRQEQDGAKMAGRARGQRCRSHLGSQAVE